MFKRVATLTVEFFIAAAVILFFSTFGQSASFSTAVHADYALIANTIEGIQIKDNFSGVSWQTIWDSFRLLAVSVIMSILIGFLHALFSVRIRSRTIQGINELAMEILQSLPEAMYVIVVFVGLVYLLKNGINLPGFFYDGLPRFQDTFAPAFALALPGSFYMSRVLTLRLRDERNVPYVDTALAKGASERRVFYRHILPNVLRVLYRQIPIVAGFVISNALFAEFFLGYMALLFRFPMFAGWGILTGSFGLKKQIGIPPFQSGAIFIVGVFLVASWFVFSMISELLQGRTPKEVEIVPRPTLRRTNVWWVVAGTTMLCSVAFLSMFPKLLTHQNPGVQHLMDTKNTTFPPFPPSSTYPLGTDHLGRDLLSMTLSGTFTTMSEVLMVTGMVLIGSIALATWMAVGEQPRLLFIVSRAGRILSSIPTLFIVFLALYHRNLHSPLQSLQYMTWIAIFEIARGSNAFYGAMHEWFQFRFVEGAIAIGRSRFSILYQPLRSWFGQFTLEFGFTELTRILSLMTILAMFRTYPVERVIYVNGQPGVGPAHTTWFSLLSDSASQMSSIITYPFLIYAPLIFLLAVMLGAGFIARGFRGVN